LTLVTSAALSLDWAAGFVDINSTTGATPGSSQGNVTTATTTTVVAAPAASVQRQLKSFTAVNKDATLTQTITLNKVTGAGAFALARNVPLSPNEVLLWVDSIGFVVLNASGVQKVANAANASDLTGSALAAGVTASSLTSLGIVTALSAGSITSTGNTVLGDTSTDTLNVGNGGLVKDASGNVLVGETTAGYSSANRGLVEINGASSALLGLRVSSVNKGYLFHSGTDLFLSNDANGAFGLNTNAVTRLNVSAAGNVYGTIGTPGMTDDFNKR